MITLGYKQSGNCWMRAALSICLGVAALVICLNGGDIFKIFVQVCGSFVVAAGLFSLIYGLIKRKENDFALMMVNAGVDIILGAIMFAFAGGIAKVIFYLIAAVMIFFSLWQVVTLLSARKYIKAGWGFYILPIVVLALGITLMIPGIDNALGYLCSAVLIIDGTSEIVTLLEIRKAIKNFEKTVSQASADEQ